MTMRVLLHTGIVTSRALPPYPWAASLLGFELPISGRSFIRRSTARKETLHAR